MSTQALQRVVVRMLFDPAFCAQVYANPVATLQAVDLTAEERQWLVTPPQQAYGADAHRRSRALTGLLEEYPVAGALAVRSVKGVERLYRFFASVYFHQCVQERGSMAEAFGHYLQSDRFADIPEMAGMAAIELGVVQVRRASDLPAPADSSCGPETRVRVAPWVKLLQVHTTALPRYSVLFEYLRNSKTSLLEAILDTSRRLPGRPTAKHAADEWLLIVGIPGTDDPSLEAASHELGTLLSAAQQDIVCRELCDLAVRLGADPAETADLIAGFLAERLLVRLS